jgi:putative Mg2+ transporter-C (MgtC) family protein
LPPSTSLVPLNQWEVFFRLGLSLVVGAIIGLEREFKHKPAGLRTNMLVSFGSALFILIPLEIGTAQQSSEILGRAISGVITGVGFIGAGTVLGGERVRGLTSAAAIWVSSALGVAVACGLWKIGLFGAVVTWVVLRVFHDWEARF